MKGIFSILTFTFLLSNCLKADPTEKLFEAIEAIDHEAIKVSIMAGANVRARNDQGETVLHVCARVGDAVPMNELVASGADVNDRNALGQTPLHVASAYGHEAEVRALVALNANVLAVDKEGKTASELAGQNDEWGIIEFLSKPVEEARKRPTPSLFANPLFMVPAAGFLAIAGITYFKNQGE